MASNLQLSGVDMDGFFAARVNTAGANVGYQVAGSDIATRYEPISSANYTLSASTPTVFIGQRMSPNTNFQSVGSDLINKFCGNNALYSTSTPTMSPPIVARTSSWTGTVNFSFTATWGSTANFVSFWNAGGRIQVSISRTGGSAITGNTAITNMLNSMGTAVIADTATYITGAGTNSITPSLRYGGTNAPSTITTVTQIAGQSSPYAGDLLRVAIRTITAQTQLQITVNVVSSDSGVIFDPIDGTLTPTVQSRVYGGASTSPTFAVTTNF